ncbi:MAG: peptidylprolyl isomerase [Oscillospiraceae bacterium]|nr:peptidylprolyl isomerase [Oscillospiraceae bacterium]
MVDKVINKFSDKIYNSETSKYAPDKADVDRLAEEKGILASKHILLLSKETPEENEQILAKMNEILERIQNGEDFDELMNEYSEDTGLATNPNGYTFMPGEMVDEFYDATASLKVGEVSGIVPSSYGYHIIKRIDPDYEETVNRLISVVVNDELQERLENAKVKLGSGFDKIQFSDFGLVPKTEETEETDAA